MPRDVGEWTKDKLLVLSRYLPGYLQATTRAIDRIYIDGFAGPGKNRLDRTGETIDGSPLIALKAQAANGTRFSRFFFIEQQPSLAVELEHEIGLLGPKEPWAVLRGDINQELPALVKRLPPRSPIFIFLDTEGIEPKWSTLEAIARWRVEFLINFPLGMSINRNPNSAKVLEYFGTQECIPVVQGAEAGRTRALLDLYKGRLAGLGLMHTTENDLLVKTLANRRLYYLVHVSKVKPAKTIMDWAFAQPDSRGQGKFQI